MPHPIAFHKDLLGWIPAAEKYLATGGSGQITLERLALPETDNVKLAQIPIPGSAPRFYTVEARQRVGYDRFLPADGVIIHQVDLTRGDRVAQIVDGDHNGDPNDAGATWTVGETFTDGATGITVAVLAATVSGYVVEIRPATASPAASPATGPAPAPARMAAPFPAVTQTPAAR
jgi:hypothetical protein